MYLKNPNKTVVDRYRISRLIIETYKGNPNNLNNVLHLNGNKEDNSLVNLIWSNASCLIGMQKPYSRANRRKIREDRKCHGCNTFFKVTTKRVKFCSLLCSRRNAAKFAGLASAAVRNTRGKNEIHFAELCSEYFKDKELLLNKPIFNGWDADVIIPHLKIEVL